MRALAALALASLLLAPIAIAQDANQPSPRTGNNGTTPGSQDSVEGAPGISFWVFALLGALALGVVLLFVTTRRDRQRRRPPG